MTLPGLSRSLIRDRTWNFFMDAIVFAGLVRRGLRGRRRGPLLVQRSRGGRSNLSFAGGHSALRLLLAGAHDHRIPAEPCVRHRIWIYRRLQQTRGSRDARRTRHPAIHSGLELPAGRHARDGLVVSITPVGSGIRIHRAHLHGPGLEHGVQFLCLAQGSATRIDGGVARLPLQQPPAILATRIAARRHRTWFGTPWFRSRAAGSS